MDRLLIFSANAWFSIFGIAVAVVFLSGHMIYAALNGGPAWGSPNEEWDIIFSGSLEPGEQRTFDNERCASMWLVFDYTVVGNEGVSLMEGASGESRWTLSRNTSSNSATGVLASSELIPKNWSGATISFPGDNNLQVFCKPE